MSDYDGQAKGHDPLCPYGPHRAPTVAPCRTCLVINKVRADEREQAAQRVLAIENHWSSCPEWAGEPCTCGLKRLIAAARGEE